MGWGSRTSTAVIPCIQHDSMLEQPLAGGICGRMFRVPPRMAHVLLGMLTGSGVTGSGVTSDRARQPENLYRSVFSCAKVLHPLGSLLSRGSTKIVLLADLVTGVKQFIRFEHGLTTEKRQALPCSRRNQTCRLDFLQCEWNTILKELAFLLVDCHAHARSGTNSSLLR